MSVIALQQRLASLFGFEYAVMLGRARSGLVALIEVFQEQTSAPIPVIIPENICPVLVTAIRAGGGITVPVAVCPHTGLPNDQAFMDVMMRIDNPGIISPTHLYGFMAEYPKTLELAHRKGWFVLENDTNAIRMAPESSPFGDALLVSFGYAKPIDVGSGGAFLTNDHRLAQSISARLATYDILDRAARIREEDCMLKRRAVRQTLDIKSAELANICDIETGLSRFRFDERKVEPLMTKLDIFPEEKMKRIERRGLWDRALAPLDHILQPVPLKQPVPWRLIRRLVSGRQHFTQKLWANKIDAGINYRSLWRELPAGFLTGTPSLPDLWGDTVLNLWVTKDYDKARIEKAVYLLKEVADDR